jgi:DNA ligase-1
MILKTLSLLEDTSGSNDKVEILKQSADDQLFKRVLSLALSPYVQFYVRAVPTVTEHTSEISLEEALDRLAILSSREKTGHDALDHLTNLLTRLSPEDATVLTRVVKKDLRCKVGPALVNKAIPKLIPKYPCMLAREQSDKNLANIKYPAYSQIKSDGMRANIIYENGTIIVRGRSGKEIKLRSHLFNEFMKLGEEYGEPCVFDGELLVMDDDGTFCCRKKGNGILNRAIVKEIPDEQLSMVRVRVWDVIPLVSFKKGKCVIPYKERFETVLRLLEGHSVRNGALSEVIPYKIVNSFTEAEDHYFSVVATGEEGTIIKNICGHWEDKRSKNLVKLKAELECDLVIVGWKEGTGQFAGQIGSIICQSADGEIEVDVGSGFTEEDRKRDPSSLISSIVTIRYNERIQSKSDKKESLYLPRVVELDRSDKSEADCSKDIK